MSDDGMSWAEKALFAAEVATAGFGALGPGGQAIVQDQFGVADPTPLYSIAQEVTQDQLEGLGELEAQQGFDELNSFGAPGNVAPGLTPPL